MNRILLIVCVLVVGCTEKDNLILGKKYKANHGLCKEYIIFLDNSTYTHGIESFGYMKKGKYSKNENRVTLRSFEPVCDWVNGGAFISGVSPLSVQFRISNGKLMLGNPEEGYHLE